MTEGRESFKFDSRNRGIVNKREDRYAREGWRSSSSGKRDER